MKTIFAITFSMLLLSLALYSQSAKTINFPYYGADPANTKYVDLDQIDADNFDQLEIAWRWTSVDQPVIASWNSHPDHGDQQLWTWTNESTPVFIDGVLYVSTSLSQVAAIDATSGATLWSYNPESYLEGSPPNHGFVHRGVAYHEDGAQGRIFIGTGDGYLIALNARTGEPIETFGDRGRIDLTKGLRRPIDRLAYGVSSPPIVCRNTVVVGATILDYPLSATMPPGDIRGFDALTGAVKWTFESVPQGTAEGAQTWEDDSWKTTGNTNVWTFMSADEELGYFYLPFGTPSNDYYGGNRLGDNLFAESLVAVDAETGEKVWHYQIVHHGLWDYDLPTAPILMDLEVEGRFVPAVAQLTKHGFCFVFDRRTGEPVWPIEERPVPASAIPGERAAATQPFPTKPPPYDLQGLTEDDLIDFTPELRQKALDYVNQFEWGPLFTPPARRGTILMPGIAGGANWAGAVFNPNNNHLYIPSITLPFIVNVQPIKGELGFNKYIHGFTAPAMLNNLPVTKPPYGRITAIDMNAGEKSWVLPMGDGPVDHPALRDLKLSNLGNAFRTQVLGTKTLLLAAQDGGIAMRMYASRGHNIAVNSSTIDPALHAISYDSGEIVGKIALPDNARGALISYVWKGRQYIVVPTGGASMDAELVALALPD